MKSFQRALRSSYCYSNRVRSKLFHPSKLENETQANLKTTTEAEPTDLFGEGSQREVLLPIHVCTMSSDTMANMTSSPKICPW